MNYSVDPEAYRSALEGLRKNNVFPQKWLKMEEGSHQIRFAPSATGALVPFIKLMNHNFFITEEKKNESPICLGLIMSDPKLIELVTDEKSLSTEDFDAFKKYGCPMCKMAAYLYSLAGSNKEKKEQAKRFMPNTRVLWNVVDRRDNKPYVWASSPTFAESLLDQLSQYPLLFDPDQGNDVIVRVTGVKAGKRYGAPVIVREASRIGDVELYDLTKEGILSGVYSYKHMLGLIKTGHPDLLANIANTK